MITSFEKKDFYIMLIFFVFALSSCGHSFSQLPDPNISCKELSSTVQVNFDSTTHILTVTGDQPQCIQNGIPITEKCIFLIKSFSLWNNPGIWVGASDYSGYGVESKNICTIPNIQTLGLTNFKGFLTAGILCFGGEIYYNLTTEFDLGSVDCSP